MTFWSNEMQRRRQEELLAQIANQRAAGSANLDPVYDSVNMLFQYADAHETDMHDIHNLMSLLFAEVGMLKATLARHGIQPQHCSQSRPPYAQDDMPPPYQTSSCPRCKNQIAIGEGDRADRGEDVYYCPYCSEAFNL